MQTPDIAGSRASEAPCNGTSARLLSVPRRMVATVAVVSVWDDLRVELLRLEREDPSPLIRHPNPRDDNDRPPPYTVTLKSSAVAVAEALYARFGDQLRLRVGALPYPPTPDASTTPAESDSTDVSDLPHGLAVRLSAPLQVRSGEVSRASVEVSNATGQEVVVKTSGKLVASVVDPSTAKRVGGFSGYTRMPLVRFTVPPDGSTLIPLLVGTASFVQDLGYAVPPGDWALTVDLSLGDGRKVRTAPMAFQIIS